MKQIFYYPTNVTSVELNTNGTCLLGFFQKSQVWSQQLPAGTWYISEQHFLERKIILWNGLHDILDKFEYKVDKIKRFHKITEYQDYLNKFGEEGWELTSSIILEGEHDDWYQSVFKRKIIKGNN